MVVVGSINIGLVSRPSELWKPVEPTKEVGGPVGASSGRNSGSTMMRNTPMLGVVSSFCGGKTCAPPGWTLNPATPAISRLHKNCRPEVGSNDFFVFINNFFVFINLFFPIFYFLGDPDPHAESGHQPPVVTHLQPVCNICIPRQDITLIDEDYHKA